MVWMDGTNPAHPTVGHYTSQMASEVFVLTVWGLGKDHSKNPNLCPSVYEIEHS